MRRRTDLRERPEGRLGYQWTVFGEMTEPLEEDSLEYVRPVARDFFNRTRGLGAKCGFGRYVSHAVGPDIEGWARRAGLVNVRSSPAGISGWRLLGEVPGFPPGSKARRAR